MSPDQTTRLSPELTAIRRFYDALYHKKSGDSGGVSTHLRRLARRLGIPPGDCPLDVGCGTRAGLLAGAANGTVPAGIDFSRTVIEICRRKLPQAELHCWVAWSTFWSRREMIRVSRHGARFLFPVPNVDFLTHRLGLCRGTEQARIREEVLTLAGWENLFKKAGLVVTKRWRDLHLLSLSWILRGAWYGWPIRAAQPAALPFWPVSWQYQGYYLCAESHHDG